MSIQAMSWVLSQPAEDLPGTARLVMMALANHADHTDGHCWPSVPTIAKEAGVGERTVSRWLGALMRNGFIDKRQTQRNGHFRSNDYWILFDREPAPWRFFEKENDPDAKMADGETASDPESRTPMVADGRTPLVADGIEAEPSESEPSDPENISDEAQPTELCPAEAPAPPALPIAKPNGFDANKRRAELDRIKAAEEARRPKTFPVIRGSEPWKAWVRHGHSDTLYGNIVMPDGRRDIGWNFPTLWPPKKSEALPDTG